MPPLAQNLPFYRIFVAEANAPRDGRHIDVVGHFDPHPGVFVRVCVCDVCVVVCARGQGLAPSRSAGEEEAEDTDAAARSPAHPNTAADGNKHVSLNFDKIKCVCSVCWCVGCWARWFSSRLIKLPNARLPPAAATSAHAPTKTA